VCIRCVLLNRQVGYDHNGCREPARELGPRAGPLPRAARAGACLVLAWCLPGACLVLAWCLLGACLVRAWCLPGVEGDYLREGADALTDLSSTSTSRWHLGGFASARVLAAVVQIPHPAHASHQGQENIYL